MSEEQIKALAKALNEKKGDEKPLLSVPLAGGLFGVRVSNGPKISFEYQRKF